MIVREATVALSRRQRGDGADDEPEAKPAEAKPEVADAKPAEAKEKQDDTTPLPMKPGDAKKSEAKPTPAPDLPRAKTETIAMPGGDLGRPPEMPQSVAPPPLALGDVESPTHMPGPRTSRAASQAIAPRRRAWFRAAIRARCVRAASSR